MGGSLLGRPMADEANVAEPATAATDEVKHVLSPSLFADRLSVVFNLSRRSVSATHRALAKGLLFAHGLSFALSPRICARLSVLIRWK